MGNLMYGVTGSVEQNSSEREESEGVYDILFRVFRIHELVQRSL